MLRIGSLAAMAGLVPVMMSTVTGPVLAHPAAKVSTSAFRVAVSQHYGQPQNASGFSVILVTTRRTAWAFGGTNPGGQSSPVAGQWNGRRMTPSALPAGLTGFISDASAASPRDIWAASEYGRYLVHWNGRRWSLAHRWRHGAITGLAATSAHDVWVFGTSATGVRENGTWHYNGQSWQRVPGLASGIYRASVVSRTNIWALSADAGTTVILRLHGSKWRRVHTGSALAGVQANDILAQSGSNVWVLGSQTGRHSEGRLILVHWNGVTWVRLPSKLMAWGGRLAPGWHGSVLATATPVGASADGLLLQATALGWISATKIQSGEGSGVSDVAVARGSRVVLVSGGVLTRLGGNAAIWDGDVARLASRSDDDD